MNNNFSHLRVALDGPSGAGKSTIAKEVAKRTGLIYVDTGALYRTVGLYVSEHNIACDDKDGIIACLPDIDIKLAYENGEQKVYLNGECVGNKIRTENASVYSSAVSKIPEVREFLLGLQRSLAHGGGVIMDGRDIGTVIMPEAEVKVFMTASPEVRAKRRYDEQISKGIDVSYEEILDAIIKRDRQDSERDTAPLKPAEDAVIFYNDDCGIEKCAEYIIKLMEEKII